MKRSKFIFGIISAFTTLMLCMSSYVTAFAYEAPKDIELYIGTTEISKAELREDTIVELPLYIRNNPGLMSFSVVIALDDGPEFRKYYEVSPTSPNISNIPIHEFSGTDRVISALIMSGGQGKFYDNGEIAKISVIVPKNTPAGRYEIEFLRRYEDEEMDVLAANSYDAFFGSECFSKLAGGAVIVKPNGDVNGDGVIDSADLVKVASHVKGFTTLTAEEQLRADMNGDEIIDTSDITLLAAYIKGTA